MDIVNHSSGIEAGVVVIELLPGRFDHLESGEWHGGVVNAVSRIRNGRKIYEVGRFRTLPTVSVGGSR